MKSSIKHIILLLVATSLFVACHNNSKTANDMTDSEKLEMLDIKIEKNPKDAKLLAERAKVLVNLSRAKEAVYDINRAVSLDPDNIDYRIIQADAYFANGDIENSYKSLGEAEKIDPENDEVLLKMGEITFYARDYDRSFDYLSKVTAKKPNDRTALFMKGFIYKEKGDTASAVTLLRKVCDLYPDYEPSFEELGMLYASRQNPLAVDYLTTAMQIEPNNTNAIYGLAMYYQDIEEYDKAEELYRQMLSINDKSADAWHNLGYLEMTHYGDFKQAVEYFDKALEADPTHEAAAHNRQLALENVK